MNIHLNHRSETHHVAFGHEVKGECINETLQTL